MDTSNMDSDDDVIFVETEPVEIEVITLSDDETNTSSTSISTFSTPTTPSLTVNYIKRDIDSAGIGTPRTLQYNISPLQLFSQNPSGSGFKLLQKMKINSRKFKKRSRRDKQIGKLLPKSESNNNSQKKSENKNKAWPNQPQVNYIQIEKQTVHIPPSSDLSRSNNSNVEPEDNLQENSMIQSVDIVNQLQATRADIENFLSSCNLNIEPSTTMEYNNDLRNQSVVNESQAGLSSNMEKTGSSCNLNVEPPITRENNNVQGDLGNQSIVNGSQVGLSSNMEKTGSSCNLNVEPSITTENNDLQDDLSNQSVVNEPQAGLSTEMEKTRSLCELNVESTATVEDNYLQVDSRSENVVVMDEPQADPTSTSVESPAEPENNDQDMNRDENPPAQQSATHNTFQVQQGSHSMQHNRDENPPAQKPATSNTFHVQQDNYGITHQLFKKPNFSNAEYCDPFLSVIVEERYPDVQYLTEYHLLILRRLVGYKIDDVLVTGTFVPRFRDSYIKNGVILVESLDVESQTWLRSIIPTLNPGPGVKLIAVSPRELNQTYKVKICVYHDTSTQQSILTRIQRQNPDINMGSWQLQSVHHLDITKKNSKSGIILHMSIPAYSVKLLENRKFKLHYGLFQVDVIMKDAYYKKKC